MGTLRAGVQYDDWRGTSAADNTDKADMLNYLQGKGLIQSGEFLVGVDVWIGENHGGPSIDASVTVLLATGNGYDTVRERLDAESDPLQLRKVEFDIPLADLFGLFKRFNIVITRKGLGLEDRSYSD